MDASPSEHFSLPYDAGVPDQSDRVGTARRSDWTVLIGRPLRSSETSKERITPVEGLSALSLDALTSVAYGPEAIIVVLALAGAGALHLVLPITVAIVVLLAILVFSYRQVIDAYPGGGGAYAVSRANLGPSASLVAGAALIVDYTLTVAVSIAAGVGSLTSAFPSLTPATVPICLAILAVITLLNLRGLGETARAFLLPTIAVHRRLTGHHRHRADPSAGPERSPARPLPAADPRAADGRCAAGAEGVLRRLQRAHRRGGDRQRRPPVQGAPGGPGQANRAPARGHPGRHAARPGRPGQTVAYRSQFETDRAQPDHGHRRRAALGLLHRLPHHHRRSRPGRQHLVRRSSDPGQPAGAGQLPPPSVLHTRRSAGLRKWHLGARGARRLCC